MINYKPVVVGELKKILPTYYELFVDSNNQLPCITYLENDNSVSIHTAEAGVSDIRYTIKLWGYSIQDLSDYSLQIDEAMRNLGFRRYSYNELATDTQICLIMNYEGLALEKY